MSIYFAQHGLTECSKKGLIAPPDETLHVEGVVNATDLGAHLEALLGDRILDRVITSYTARTLATGIIATEAYLTNSVITQDHRLDPRGVPQRYVSTPADKLPWKDEAKLVALGIEPAADVLQRTAELLEEIGGHAGHTLLVGHSSSLPALIEVCGLPAGTTLSRGQALDLGDRSVT